MVLDALRAYAQLASGLGETTRQRAMATVKNLAGQSGLGVEQLRGLTEELLAAGRDNRGLIRHEIEKAVSRLGLVTTDDLHDLTRRLDRLEKRCEELAAQGASTADQPADRRAEQASEQAARRAPAKKAPAKKRTGAATKKTPTKKTAAGKTAAKKTPAKGTSSRGSGASRGSGP